MTSFKASFPARLERPGIYASRATLKKGTPIRNHADRDKVHARIARGKRFFCADKRSFIMRGSTGIAMEYPMTDTPKANVHHERQAPTHLIMVGNSATHELRAISACAGEAEAEAVFENLAQLFKGTPNIVHKVPLPTAPGFVRVEIVSAGETPPPPPPPAPAPAVPALAAVWTEKPAPFRRMSQAEFEAETVAMMNGEIDAGGLVARDADAPLSEGGAVSG